MGRVRALLVLLAVALATSGAMCGVTDLYDPPPANVAVADEDRVRRAIVAALDHRGWIAEQREAGIVYGTLNVEDKQAVVRIDYGPSSYQIRYVGSRNLGFETTRRGHKIHGRYNGWIRNLERDIRTLLGGGTLEVE